MTMGKGSSKGFVNLLPATVLHKMTDLYLMITSLTWVTGRQRNLRICAVYAYILSQDIDLDLISTTDLSQFCGVCTMYVHPHNDSISNIFTGWSDDP